MFVSFECSPAVVRQDRDEVAVIVRGDQVRLPVPVQIAKRREVHGYFNLELRAGRMPETPFAVPK